MRVSVHCRKLNTRNKKTTLSFEKHQKLELHSQQCTGKFNLCFYSCIEKVL